VGREERVKKKKRKEKERMKSPVANTESGLPVFGTEKEGGETRCKGENDPRWGASIHPSHFFMRNRDPLVSRFQIDGRGEPQRGSGEKKKNMSIKVERGGSFFSWKRMERCFLSRTSLSAAWEKKGGGGICNEERKREKRYHSQT